MLEIVSGADVRLRYVVETSGRRDAAYRRPVVDEKLRCPR